MKMKGEKRENDKTRIRFSPFDDIINVCVNGTNEFVLFYRLHCPYCSSRSLSLSSIIFFFFFIFFINNETVVQIDNPKQCQLKFYLNEATHTNLHKVK